jgi:hypothetical protein
MYTTIVTAETNPLLLFCNQAVVGVLLPLNLDAPPTPKPQIHKATKREKRHCTSDPGSHGAASRSATA